VEGGSDVAAIVRNSFARAASQLADAGVADEARAEFVPAHRRALVFRRAARMHPLGRVWRLGVILLDSEGNGFATGSITRAQSVAERPNYHAASAEERRIERAAALRAGYSEGETVNFATTALDPEHPAGPLVVHGSEVRVLWAPGTAPDAATPLDAYLAERVALLLEPPQGA